MNSKYALIRLTLSTLLTVIAIAPPARAANPNPPGKMTFQGFLTDAGTPPVPLGNSSPENKTVIFKIYKSATGTVSTDVVWAESQVVTVDKGHFSVLLGEGSAVTGFSDKHPTDLSSVFIGADASDRWIGLTLDGTEMTPRIQFFAAPYAHMARAASSLVNPVSGASILNLANGKLEGASEISATGAVTSLGSVAGLIFADRNGSGVWQWYAEDGTARLWNGTDRVAVTSDGKLGIGTSTPAATLHVNGSTRIDGANILELGGGVAGKEANAGKIGYQSFTAGALDIIGAGTSTRSIKLWDNVTVGGTLSAGATTMASTTVSGAAKVNGGLSLGDTLANTKLALYDAGVADGIYGLGVQAAQFRMHLGGTAARFSFLGTPSATTELMTIKGDGNVGINTSNPSANLHVNGPMKIEGSNTLEFGAGLAKMGAAGTIGYDIYGAGALHIVGSGTVAANIRKVRIWDRLGIGTDSPTVPLHVEGSVGIDASWQTALKPTQSPPDWFSSAQTAVENVSIYASASIRANRIVLSSDARIKEITGRTSGSEAMESIRKLKVTDYLYVDKISNGLRPHRGLIAQEVEKVLPDAVSQNTGVVPDIYVLALTNSFDAQSKALSITIEKPHGLKIDDVVRLVMETGQTDAKVNAVPSASSFIVTAESRPGKVFVFGKQVNDFRTVDYDRIFTTGIGAIQELDRRVEELRKSEARIAELEQKTGRMAELEAKAARVDSLERKVEELTKLVAGLAQDQTPRRVAGRNAPDTGGE